MDFKLISLVVRLRLERLNRRKKKSVEKESFERWNNECVLVESVPDWCQNTLLLADASRVVSMESETICQLRKTRKILGFYLSIRLGYEISSVFGFYILKYKFNFKQVLPLQQ